VKPRAVIHVTANRYPPLPVEHHTLAIWRELAKVAVEYHVFARSAAGPGGTSRHGNIHLHLVPSRLERQAEVFVTGWAVSGLALAIRPEVIVTQCPVMGGWAAARAARSVGAALFVEMHGEHLFHQSGMWAWRSAVFTRLARPVLERAAAVRVLSRQMLASLRATYGQQIAEKGIIVPTRVDVDVFCRWKNDYRLTGPLKLVCVGSYIPLKNHLALMRDVASVPGVSLTIVGQGPLRTAYEREIRRLGLQARVRLVPWMSQEDLAHVLAQHDAYVHYSTTEALSRSILEAMAVGLPVVATRVGFVDGLLVDGVNALVLEAPWHDGLLRAIARLAADERLRRQLGDAARSTIERDYSAAEVFGRYRSAIVGAAELSGAWVAPRR
jgi:glycosyltransferase involved in cell wall biosynthesis